MSQVDEILITRLVEQIQQTQASGYELTSKIRELYARMKRNRDVLVFFDQLLNNIPSTISTTTTMIQKFNHLEI